MSDNIMVEEGMKLVSVIMPAYNNETFIAEAIDSVLNQDYTNWELIIVDDYSTDNTGEVIKSYQNKDSRIKYLRLDRNSGTAVARNNAIKIAMGHYIAFLDSDDTWTKDKLTKQINFMEKNSYDFTCTNYMKMDDTSNYLGKTVIANSKSDYNKLLKMSPGNLTVIYNSEKLGKFEIPNIRKRNDYVLWLQIIKKAKYLYGFDKTLGSHRVRKGSISSKKTDLVKYHWHVYREIEKLPIFKSLYLVVYWIATTIFKLR